MKQKRDIKKPKDSELDALTWKYIKVIYFMKLVICLFAASYHVVYLVVFKEDLKTWIDYSFFSLGKTFLLVFCSWVLILV